MTGTLSVDGVSAAINVRPQETITVDLSVAGGDSFEGTVQLEISRTSQLAWQVARDKDGQLVTFTGTVDTPLADAVCSVIVKNGETRPVSYRVRALGIAADPVAYDVAQVDGDIVATILRDASGRAVLGLRDDGAVIVIPRLYLGDGLQGALVGFETAYITTLNGVAAAGLINLQSVETIVLSGTPQPCDLGVYKTGLTTRGGGTTGTVDIGDGTGAVIGQRHLVQIDTFVHSGDKAALDQANIVTTPAFPASSPVALSAVTLDAADAFVLLEWDGVNWVVIYSRDATLTPV